MSLAEEIAQIPIDSGCCTTGCWYRQQEQAVQHAFDAYVADVKSGVRKSYVPLHTVCSRNGLKISIKAFRDHCNSHVRG